MLCFFSTSIRPFYFFIFFLTYYFIMFMLLGIRTRWSFQLILRKIKIRKLSIGGLSNRRKLINDHIFPSFLIWLSELSVQIFWTCRIWLICHFFRLNMLYNKLLGTKTLHKSLIILSFRWNFLFFTSWIIFLLKIIIWLIRLSLFTHRTFWSPFDINLLLN